MARNTVNTTVSLDPADALFPHWTTSITASELFREVLAEQMAYREIDRAERVALVGDALEPRERNLDDLVEQTSSVEELESLLEPTWLDTCSNDE